jgi:signal peptidase II
LGATHLNSGVAFSIAAGSSLVIFLIIIGTIALLYLAKNLDLANLWVQVSLGLIVGGGLSNIIDRIFFGSVVDYIRILDLTVFNLADAGIIVGVGILIFKVLNKKTNS